MEVLTLSLVMMFSFGVNLHFSYSYVKITGLKKSNYPLSGYVLADCSQKCIAFSHYIPLETLSQKDSSHINENCHPFLTFMSFQTSKTYILT